METLVPLKEAAHSLVAAFSTYLKYAEAVSRDVRHLLEDGDSRCTPLAEAYLHITSATVFHVQRLCATQPGELSPTISPPSFPRYPAVEDLPRLLDYMDPPLRRVLCMILQDTLGNAVSPLCLMDSLGADSLSFSAGSALPVPPASPEDEIPLGGHIPSTVAAPTRSEVREEAVAGLKAGVLHLLDVVKGVGG